MGFLDRIKQAFDSGGVKVSISAEKSFRWSDDTMPVEVTLTNTTDEAREIAAIRLQLVEYDRENPASTRKVRGRYEGLNFFVREPFSIDPRGSYSTRIDMPLSVTGVADELGAEAPGWVAGVSAVVNTLKDASRDHEWYLLRVIPEITGFTAQKIATHRLRNLRAGEWGDGIFTTRIGGG